MEIKNKKRVGQYYTRKKFNEKSQCLKKINRLYGQRGGIRL